MRPIHNPLDSADNPGETYVPPWHRPPPAWTHGGYRDVILMCAVLLALAIFTCAWAIVQPR